MAPTISLVNVLAAAGATLIVTRSSLFAQIFLKLGLLRFQFFSCPMCVGFWSGVAFSFLPTGVLFDAFRYGCIVSASAYTLVLVLDKLEKTDGV